ncbi:hypothetical protein GZH53_08845 [Flavihumibacter sp. R14]|nr:hypothetical protein [Flavihumibacter soli]
MKLLTLLITGSLLFSGCDKKEPIIQNVPGVMRISNTGACRVLIELNSGKSLFPTNLDKLQSFLTNGREVTVSYRHDADFVSPCSGSEPALIESIR